MKHVIKFIFILMLLGTLWLIYQIVNITWVQYQDTKDWESIAIQGELKDVPPFLAKNYINLQDKEAVETWQEINKILADLSNNKRIPADKLEEYKAILERSRTMQETYDITSGTIADQNDQLALYLDIENALNTAYDTPCTDELKSLTGKLYSANLDNNSKIQISYLELLKSLAKDYKEANKFMKETLPTLGTLSDGVLTGNTEMDEESTTKFIEDVKEKKLDKFGFINSLLLRLQGDEWVKVLTHNQILRDYELWQDAKKKLHAIQTSDYVLVGNIKTYQDVLDAKLETDVKKKSGYSIDKESAVLSITYDGQILEKDKYIKKGSDAVVQIDAKYIEKDKTEDDPDKPKTSEESTEILTTDVSTEVPVDASTEITTEINTEDRDLPPVISTEAVVTP